MPRPEPVGKATFEEYLGLEARSRVRHGEEADDGSRHKRFPCFVVEVLSESTSDTDREEKPRNCRKIPSLKAYVLVSCDRRLVEVYRRLEDGTWRYETLEESGELELPCLSLTLSLEEVYASS